jgi:hypothetical protein
MKHSPQANLFVEVLRDRFIKNKIIPEEAIYFLNYQEPTSSP